MHTAQECICMSSTIPDSMNIYILGCDLLLSCLFQQKSSFAHPCSNFRHSHKACTPAIASRNSTFGNSLATSLETLNILESNHDGLPFRRLPGFQPTLDVPRYLFRVSSPGCAGLTTPDLAQSASAASNHALVADVPLSPRRCLARRRHGPQAPDLGLAARRRQSRLVDEARC